MNNIKEIATEVYQNIKRNNFELAGKVNINNIDRMNVNLIIDLVRKFCELQKQECDNSALIDMIDKHELTGYPVYGVDSESILNCKNVCDE